MRVDLKAFRYLPTGRLWKEVWLEVNEDDCWGMAAQLSYYLLLAFFPFLIFLSALVGYIPFDPELVNKILLELRFFLPDRTYYFVEEIVLGLIYSPDSRVLFLGIVLALWSASIALNGLVGILNRAYEVRDTRSYLRVRLLAMGVTIVVSIFVLLSAVLLFFGDWLISLLINISFEPHSILQVYATRLYSWIRWVLVFLLINIGVQILFFSLPARRLAWTLLSPGSVVATLGWIFGSQGFAYYINNFANYQRLYGSLATMVVFMIWFYFSSLFLLLGAEIDSEIYRIRRETGLVPDS